MRICNISGGALILDKSVVCGGIIFFLKCLKNVHFIFYFFFYYIGLTDIT